MIEIEQIKALETCRNKDYSKYITMLEEGRNKVEVMTQLANEMAIERM